MSHTSMPTPLRAGIALAGTVALSAAMLAPAHADSLVDGDAKRDVVKLFPNSTDPAPREISIDVVHTRFAHTAEAVRVTVRLRDLKALPKQQLGTRIRTSQGDYEAALWKWKAGDKPEFGFFDDSEPVPEQPRFASLAEAGGERAEAQCAGMTGHIKPGTDTMRLVIPRACLGNPTWVRVGAFTARATRAGLLADSALARGEGGFMTMTERLFADEVS